MSFEPSTKGFLRVEIVETPALKMRVDVNGGGVVGVRGADEG